MPLSYFGRDADTLDGYDSTDFLKTGSNVLTGSQHISGSLYVLHSVHANDFTGSLTMIDDGVPYILAGPYITITTNSLGQIEITGSAGSIESSGSGPTYFYSLTNSIIQSSGSLYVSGAFRALSLSASNGAEITGSFRQGYNVVASGLYSHAEGLLTTASADYAHAEGDATRATGQYSHVEGSGSLSSGKYSHAEGFNTLASQIYSHAEGYLTTASATSAHAEGQATRATGPYSHAEGWITFTSGQASHAEGYFTSASAVYAHAEGERTIAAGYASHAEGYFSEVTAQGYNAHAEGYASIASASFSHAEGASTKTRANYSHAEGYGTITYGLFSHTEGDRTETYGDYSHAEGLQTVTTGAYSHAEGWGTIASGSYQHVQGKFNKRGNDFSLFVIGDGTGTTDQARSDILRVNSGTLAGTGRVEVTGTLAATRGLSGSLTKLVDGTNYLLAGTNITLSTGSNGAVTISSTATGGASTNSKQIAYMTTKAGTITQAVGQFAWVPSDYSGLTSVIVRAIMSTDSSANHTGSLQIYNLTSGSYLDLVNTPATGKHFTITGSAPTLVTSSNLLTGITNFNNSSTSIYEIRVSGSTANNTIIGSVELIFS